ncbi:MAG: aspartyl protease family protein [Candidatus Binatia bacterium]
MPTVFYQHTLQVFPYSRPLIPIRLSGRPGFAPIDTLALLDSGADRCVFSEGFALRLGLDLSAGAVIPIKGATGGQLPARILHVTVEIIGVAFDCQAAFTPGNIPYNFIGREGIFEKAQWGFRIGHGIIYFDPRP